MEVEGIFNNFKTLLNLETRENRDAAECDSKCQLLNTLRNKLKESWGIEKKSLKCDNNCQILHLLQQKLKNSWNSDKKDFYNEQNDYNCNSEQCIVDRVIENIRMMDDGVELHDGIECNNDCQRLNRLKRKLYELLIHSERLP